MRALAARAPAVRTVIYVSCDPSSFGRDSRVLLDAGWRLRGLRAFDIFPMTEHVELVAALDRPPADVAGRRRVEFALGLGVPAELVLDVPGRLELERRVRHVEVV